MNHWVKSGITVGLLYVFPFILLAVSVLVGSELLVGATAVLAYGLHQVAGIALGYFLGQRNLMTGGQLVMRAVEQNDQWDVKKAQMAARLFQEGIKANRSNGGGSQIIEGEWEIPELPVMTPFGADFGEND